MADLKKKFIDILFEDEDDSKQTEQTFSKPRRPEESPIRAKDILYRRSSNNTFINLNEPEKKPTVVEDKPLIDNSVVRDDSYEMSAQISPIFGVLKENKKKDINVNQDIIDTQTSKPADSHLDIITSPIYGYGSKEDAQKNNYDVKGIDDGPREEQELHELFDDNNDDINFLNNAFEEEKSVDDIETTDEINLFKLFGENK